MPKAVVLSMAYLLLTSAAFGAECKLSHDECVIIEQELLMNDIQMRRDETNLLFMKPYPRAIKVLELETKRLKEIVTHLPSCVGNELVRMQLCDTERRTSLQEGNAEDPSRCLERPQKACLRR